MNYDDEHVNRLLHSFNSIMRTKPKTHPVDYVIRFLHLSKRYDVNRLYFLYANDEAVNKMIDCLVMPSPLARGWMLTPTALLQPGMLAEVEKQVRKKMRRRKK